MNQSFDGTNSYHLPKISQNDSGYLRTTKNNHEMRRSMSQNQPQKSDKISLTQKIVMMEDIKNV